jgi:hypothetical protein
MAGSKKENGNIAVGGTKGRAHVLELTKKGFRKDSFDAFMQDFCKVQEVGADDVGNERMTPTVWNSMGAGYSRLLRGLDQQIRVRTMGMVPVKKKMLKG